MLQRLPLVVSFCPRKKSPLAADPPRINFALEALGRPDFPTDFRLGAHRSLRQIHTRHRHGRDAFLASQKTELLVRRGLDADPPRIDAQRLGNVQLHRVNVRRDFGRLRQESGIDVDNFAIVKTDLSRRFLQENLARRVLPARIGIRKKMADVPLPDRAEEESQIACINTSASEWPSNPFV